MGRLIKYLAVLLAVFAVLALGTALATGWLLDSKTDGALRSLSRRVPGLALKNVDGKRGFFSKGGTLYVEYTLPPGLFDEKSLQLAFDYEIRMGVLGLTAEFSRVRDLGNLDRILGPYIGRLPVIGGSARASVFSLGGDVSIAAAPFTVPLDDGKCAVGTIAGDLKFGAVGGINGSFGLEELVCESSRVYQGRLAYLLKLKDLQFGLKPELSGKKLAAVTASFDAEEIAGEASTPYVIGFEPNEQVKDPTLRDAVQLQKPHLEVGFDRIEADNFGRLSLKASGSLLLALPFIREGQILPALHFDNIALSADLSPFRPAAVKQELSRDKPHLSAVFGHIVHAKLDQLRFSHEGESFEASGSAQLDIAGDERPKDLRLALSGAAGERMVEKFLGQDYGAQLQSLVNDGSVAKSGGQYSTQIRFHNSILEFNGHRLGFNTKETGDDPDEASLASPDSP